MKQVIEHLKGCVRSGTFDLIGDELHVECPGCGDNNRHFSYNLTRGLYNCFKCGTRGKVFPSVISQMPQLRRLPSRPSRNRPEKTPSLVLPFCRTILADLMDPSAAQQKGETKERPFSATVADGFGRKAIQYVVSRGMTFNQIRDYRLFVKPYDNRVYFPYWNGAGEVTFCMGRSLNPDDKIKTKEEGNKVKPLYGSHVKQYKKWVILVEGVFDHFVTPRSWAIMGSRITDDQIRMLRIFGISRVALIYDPDAAEKMELDSMALGRSGIRVLSVRLTGEPDPADLGVEFMTELYHRIFPCLEQGLTRSRVMTVYR